LRKKLNILLTEDNLIEIMKMKRTISFIKLEHLVNSTKDTEEALELLQDTSAISNIILLDLNMPEVSGIEFLSILKKNTDLKHIPVIILTTSNNPKDLIECYTIGISGYILKPLKYEDYVKKIDRAIAYWCTNELI
jgi:CheY-like chemotaxis protein